MFQAKALRDQPKGYLSRPLRASFLAESHSSFCSPLTFNEFLAVAANLFSSTATDPDRLAYLILKLLPRSGMFLHIFNLSWSLHSFLSIWKSSSVISIHKTGNFWTHLLLSRLLLSLPASQGYLSASFYLVYPSIMEFNYILSLRSSRFPL